MGLIWEIFKALSKKESAQEKSKRIERKQFEEEANALGLDKWEREECKKSGITPSEWTEENDSNDADY